MGGMALLQDVGITLNRLDYSETSQVIVFFTREHGKVRAIGKGIKRSTKTRFAPGIDLLEAGEMVFSIRQPRQEALALLTEWKQRQAFSGLRARLARLHAAQYATEVTAALTEDWDPHPILYDGLRAVLENLSTAEAVWPALVAYQGLVLQQVGSAPDLEVCAACQRPPRDEGEVWFSSFEGGLLCRDCEAVFAEKRLVDPRALSLLRGRSPERGEAADPQVRTRGMKAPDPWISAFDVLNYHLAHLMGREPLLAPKLTQMPAPPG